MFDLESETYEENEERDTDEENDDLETTATEDIPNETEITDNYDENIRDAKQEYELLASYFITNISNDQKKLLNQVVDLKYKSGEYVLNNDEEVSKEVFSMIFERNNPDYYIKYIQNCEDDEDLLWNQEELLDYKREYQYELKIYNIELRYERSSRPCPKCKEHNVRFNSQQLNSGDEGMTVLYCCINCGFEWKVR